MTDKPYTREQLDSAKVRMVIQFSNSDMSDWDSRVPPLALAGNAYGDTRIYATLKTGREVRFYGFWAGDKFYMRPLMSSDGHRQIVVHADDYIRLLRDADVENWKHDPVKNLTPEIVLEHIECEASRIMERTRE